jgi:hypothetical protein
VEVAFATQFTQTEVKRLKGLSNRGTSKNKSFIFADIADKESSQHRK